MSKNASRTDAGLPNLDLLRACAVLYVLVDHMLGALGVTRIWNLDVAWLGRTGVLFFFVHTCCVLMMSLERHRGEGLVRAFYVRRAFRIYPLSMAGVFGAMLAGPKALPAAAWIANLLLIQNLTFHHDAFGSIWSLPIEVQMYLFLPFVFMLAARCRNIWPLLALFALSIPIALWQPYHVARAQVLAFAPAFLPGVIAYWLFRRNVPRFSAWFVPLAIAALTAAMLAHPGWKFPAWSTCLALGLILPFFRQIQSAAINHVSFQIAKYSYGIYITHSVLLMWAKPTWFTAPLFVLAVAVASVLCYHLIEYPMMQLGRRLSRGMRASSLEPAVPSVA